MYHYYLSSFQEYADAESLDYSVNMCNNQKRLYDQIFKKVRRISTNVTCGSSADGSVKVGAFCNTQHITSSLGST